MYKYGHGVEKNEEMYKKVRKQALELLRQSRTSMDIAREDDGQK